MDDKNFDVVYKKKKNKRLAPSKKIKISVNCY